MFDIEKSLGFLVAKLHQKMAKSFIEVVGPHGLTPQQFAVLAFLWKKEGLTQTELSEKTLIDKATLGGVVDRLERDGVVHKVRPERDRRAYQVFLSEKGRSMRTVLESEMTRLKAGWEDRITAEELETLFLLLSKMNRV